MLTGLRCNPSPSDLVVSQHVLNVRAAPPASDGSETRTKTPRASRNRTQERAVCVGPKFSCFVVRRVSTHCSIVALVEGDDAARAARLSQLADNGRQANMRLPFSLVCFIGQPDASVGIIEY